jgi:hypothetical protein
MTDVIVSSLSKRLARDKAMSVEIESTDMVRKKNKNREDILSDLKDIGKSPAIWRILLPLKKSPSNLI